MEVYRTRVAHATLAESADAHNMHTCRQVAVPGHSTDLRICAAHYFLSKSLTKYRCKTITSTNTSPFLQRLTHVLNFLSLTARGILKNTKIDQIRARVANMVQLSDSSTKSIKSSPPVTQGQFFSFSYLLLFTLIAFFTF